MAPRERWDALDWPERLLLVVGAAGVVVWLRIVVGADAVSSWRFYPLLVGVCAGWVASVTALLALFIGTIEQKRRGRTALTGPLPARLWVLVGVGLALAAGSLLAGGFDEEALLLGLLGAIVAGIGWWRRAHPPTRYAHAALQLAVVVLAFQVPREQGRVGLRWGDAETRSTWNWSGGTHCNGSGLDDQPASVLADRPAWIIRAPGMSGDLGDLVAARLGRGDELPPHTARFDAGGRLDFAGPGCHLPGYRTGTARGSLTLSMTYLRAGGSAALACSGSYLLSYTVDAALTGIGSCHQLTAEVAAQIAAQLAAQARAVTGRQ